MNSAAWGWAQWVVLILIFLEVAAHCWMHGQQRKYDGPTALASNALFIALLWAGGFWR